MRYSQSIEFQTYAKVPFGMVGLECPPHGRYSRLMRTSIVDEVDENKYC